MEKTVRVMLADSCVSDRKKMYSQEIQIKARFGSIWTLGGL